MFLYKDSKLEEEDLTGDKQGHPQPRLKDFYEECVEMSAELEQRLNKHNWFKANSE